MASREAAPATRALPKVWWCPRTKKDKHETTEGDNIIGIWIPLKATTLGKVEALAERQKR